MSKAVSLDSIVEIIRERGASGRTMTAIAGPPAAGKSTVAEMLVAKLNRLEADSAAVVPMDGFHYDDVVLEARGLRQRKGSPETFDIAGFAHLLARLKANKEAEVAIPVFDRALEISRGSARIIPRSVTHMVIEGNYLLLDRKPWRSLRQYFDITVLLRADDGVLRDRLMSRWKDRADASTWIDTNDMPNIETVLRESADADFTLVEPAPQE